MEFNYSKDFDYHTQINNKVLPHSSCNTTSMIMALKQAGYTPKTENDMQPEDYLTTYLHSEEAKNKMKKIAPWAWDTNKDEPRIPPNEVHSMLEWAVNTLHGKKIDTFTTETTLCTIIATMVTRGGIVLSGDFPVKGKTLHHMVSLAGFINDNEENFIEPQYITHFIIDDPYGDFRTGYEDHRGNNIVISKTEFLRIFKDTGNQARKWAHIVNYIIY